jgi:hypothetical protein
MSAPKGNQYWKLAIKRPGQPAKFTKAEDMQVKIDEYFQSAITETETGQLFRPTMTGLARTLNMTREALYLYGKRDEFFNTVTQARAIVEEALEAHLYGTAVTGVIFNLKNNFKWKDKTEVENTNLTGLESKYLKDLQDRLNVGCSESE